jgi:hypothetical protein
MECRLVWIIAAIGALTLAGVFWKMKEGFGPNWPYAMVER